MIFLYSIASFHSGVSSMKKTSLPLIFMSALCLFLFAFKAALCNSPWDPRDERQVCSDCDSYEEEGSCEVEVVEELKEE